MKTYKIDLDYESYLFNSQYNEEDPTNLRIIKEFEYVFFLINREKCILKNIRPYEKNYIDYLKKLDFIIPDLGPKVASFDYWWGHHHNKKIEQFLNSKLVSAQIAQRNQWGFSEGAIIETLDELKVHLQKFPHKEKWIIKRPDSFSGIGHYQFSTDAFDESILLKFISGKVLLEPVYDRVFDIGTTFEVENGNIKRNFMVENFNSKSGSFKGGAGASNVDKFKKYIDQKYSYSLEELEKTTQKIAAIYLSMGAVSNIQIDSFVYREKEELRLYALVEVNYRKTMGLVIQSLAQKYPEANYVEWIVESAKSAKKNPLFIDSIRLSPEGNHFHSFLKLNRSEC